MVRALLAAALLGLAGCEAGPDEQLDLLGENIFTGALSKDGSLAVVGAVEGGIWVLQQGRKLHELKHSDGESALESASISPDSRRIATASGNRWHVWSAQSGRELNAGTMDSLIRAVAVDNFGRLLIGTLNGGYWLDGDNGLQLSGTTTRALALDGKRLMLGNDDGLVTLWTVGARRPSHQWQLSDQVEVVALEQDQGFAGARDAPSRLLAIGEGAVNAELAQESSYYPQPITITAARIVAGGIWLGNTQRRAAFWDYSNLTEPSQTWRMPVRKGSNPGSARIVAFSRDGQRVRALTGTGHLATLVRQ